MTTSDARKRLAETQAEHHDTPQESAAVVHDTWGNETPVEVPVPTFEQVLAAKADPLGGIRARCDAPLMLTPTVTALLAHSLPMEAARIETWSAALEAVIEGYRADVRHLLAALDAQGGNR